MRPARPVAMAPPDKPDGFEAHAAQPAARKQAGSGRSARRPGVRAVLLRLLRAPSTAARLFVDRLHAPWRLSWLGVTLGPGCSFAGHPVIWLADRATISLGAGVRVLSRPDSNPAGLSHPTMLAAIGPGSSITIGAGSGISGASLVAATRITIGRHVLVGAGACIWDTDFHPVDPLARLEHQTRGACAKAVRIEDDVFIGARALILKGVTIGRGAVVGAGAVVTNDVGARQIVAGNPARLVGCVPAQQAAGQTRP